MTNNFYRFNGIAELPEANVIEITVSATGNNCAENVGNILQAIRSIQNMKFRTESYNETKTVTSDGDSNA